MATIGLVTIVQKDKVLFKCVAGSDGYNAQKLAKKIKEYEVQNLSTQLLHSLCKSVGFGDINVDLVIQSPIENYFTSENDNLSEFYHDTERFKDPKSNPRWKCGLSDYLVIVKL
jgi:hypothetical protein